MLHWKVHFPFRWVILASCFHDVSVSNRKFVGHPCVLSAVLILFLFFFLIRPSAWYPVMQPSLVIKHTWDSKQTNTNGKQHQRLQLLLRLLLLLVLAAIITTNTAIIVVTKLLMMGILHCSAPDCAIKFHQRWHDGHSPSSDMQRVEGQN